MESVPDFCDRLVRWGLAGLIAFTPLAFGTVETWSIAIMEWAITTLVLIFALGKLWPSPAPSRGAVRAIGLALPISLFILFCLLQLVPIPRAWLEPLSPGAARMYEDPGFRGSVRLDNLPSSWTTESDPLLATADRSPRPLSIRPDVTAERVRLLVCLGALFFMVSWWADRGERVVFLLKTITIVGSVVGLFGLIQLLTWNGMIYWVRRVPPSSPFGPFVNHNHFAGYVEMVLPVAISLTFYLMELRRRPRRTVDEDGEIEAGARWGQAGLVFFSSVVLLMTLFLCRSRGGLLASVVSGTILFIVMWPRVESRPLKLGVAIALPVLVVGMIAWVGPEETRRHLDSLQGMENEASFRLRAVIWGQLLKNQRDFLLFGSGLGTFEDSFAVFTPPGSDKRWDKAHNDYLQILWETGIIGSILFLIAIISFARKYWWRAVRSREHPLDLLRVGIAFSLLSIALHSIVDFNLQIGANGFLCVLLAALLVALHHLVEEDSVNGPVPLEVDTGAL